MAYLVLVVLMLFPVVWADDATNKTMPLNMTSPISVVARQLPARPYGNHGYAAALVVTTPLFDKCEEPNKTNEELRTHKKNLAIAEKVFTAAGFVATAVGELQSGTPIIGPSAGALPKAIGAGLRATGALLGAASLGIDVQSRELEYTKCFKKEFDEFKQDFNKFKKETNENFDKVFAEFDKLNGKLDKNFNQINRSFVDLNEKLDKEFNQTKEMIKEVKELVKNIEENRVTINYKIKISSIETLEMHFRSYTKNLVQEARSNLFFHCATKDPLEVLNEIKNVHIQEVLKTKHYGVLRIIGPKIIMEVFKVARMVIACFEKTLSIKDQNESEKARLDNTEKIVNIVQNIVKQVQDGMQKAKQDLINNVIPAKFPLYSSGYPVYEWHILQTCKQNSKAVYNYLRDMHSWAEWSVVATYGRSYGEMTTEQYKVNPYTAILGEAKNIFRFNDWCSYSVIWCEQNDDKVRKENAQRFKKWKDMSFSCEKIPKLLAFVESLQNKLSSPSLPNSPKMWRGIMAIQTWEGQQYRNNSNAIYFEKNHTKFGDNNLINGHCIIDEFYDLYYHVCF